MSELTNRYFAESMAAFDKVLARISNRDMQPPEPVEIERQTPFDMLDDQQQRNLIRDHMRRWPVDEGLIGEAINEHALSGAIAAAFFVGDIEQVGKLTDRAIREYIGKTIQEHMDEEDEAEHERILELRRAEK